MKTSDPTVNTTSVIPSLKFWFINICLGDLVLSKADERPLGLYEKRVLKGIFGAVQDKVTWRNRYNHKLSKLFNALDITKYIKRNRLS